VSTSQHVAEVVIKGQTDGVSQKLKEVADGTDKVKRAADAAGASQAAWGDKLDAAEKKMDGFSKRVGQVSAVLGAAGLVGAAVGAAQALGAMAERAQQISIANQALAISIAGAREATMGLVSDYALTTAANKAVQLGVVKTDAEFAKLSATAAKLGIAMGQSAGQSVDDLTTALGRQSVMILDNLGIALKLEEAYDIYAARLGKTALQLTDAEKKQGFMTVALERAEAAAAKTNVTLDTHAARVAVLSSKWQNFSDAVAVGVTGALANMLAPTAAINELMGRTVAQIDAEVDSAQKLELALLKIADRTDGAASAMTRWLAEANLTAEAMGRVATAAIDERNLGLAREAYIERQKGNAARRDEVALERQRIALTGQALAIDEKKKRKGGKARPEQVQVDNLDRFMEGNMAGIDASQQIADSITIQQNVEAGAAEIQMREERITLIEREQELAALQIEAGIESTDLQEELAARKYRAEEDLLNFQIQAANTRGEILDLELQKRRQATTRGTAILLQAQAAENKALLQKRAAYERYGGAVGDVMGQVTVALVESANGAEYAAAKALAGIATGIRNQMILTALKEFALAVASAASFNYPGAAQHATAGGMATAAAVVAGGFGAGISAAIPSTPSVSGGAGAAGGSTSGKGESSRSKGGGEDDDGIPTSYYDGGLYSKRPDRTPHAANGSNVSTINNISVLGATTEQVALALNKVMTQGKRSLGRLG